jgi:hypothetical protein
MGKRVARLVSLGTLLAALGGAGSAAAQSSSSRPPPSSPSDQGDSLSFSGFRLSAPIRLSLEGSVPQWARMFPNCASREDSVGNSVGGIPVQHYAEIRILPRLVLSGFTQLGCPIDAGIGGALTYAVPLRSSLSLVFAAGLYTAPAQLPLFGGAGSALTQGLRGTISPVSAAARTDLVWKVGTHPYHFSVESFGPGRQQLSFGGGF